MQKSFNKPDLSKYKQFKKVSLSEEDEDGITPGQHIFLPHYESTSVSRCVKYYLDESIQNPKYYRNILHVIDTLSEGDVIEINMNSYGGAFDSAVAMLHAFRTTDAHVHCNITGTAASAGSLIALGADSVEVGPYATMMIHAASYSSGGKQSDVLSHVEFVDYRVKKLANGVYADFLTAKELEEVWMGREIWLDCDQIIERLEKRAELQEKRYKQELRKAQQLAKVTKPKASKKVLENEEDFVML